MASITKTSEGIYMIRVSKGTGANRIRINKVFRGRLADAKAHARDLETMIDSGKMPQARVTFAEVYALWIAAISQSLAPKTVEGYARSIRLYAEQHLAQRPVADITPLQIQTIYNDIVGKPTTVRNLHSALRACFSWAIKRRALTENPCKGLDLPAKARRDISTFTLAEAARFTSVCRDMPNGLIFEFALETGMRPEEYLALRWSDIQGNEAFVKQAVIYRDTVGGGFYFKEVKTARSRRRIPLSDALVARLRRHRIEQQTHRLALKVTWGDHDLVFANVVGNPFSITNLTRRYFRPILDKCDFGKHFRLYSLRHSCATILLMLDENPKTVADRLGHSSVVLTLDTYSHVLPHIQTNATNAMDKAMRG